MTTSHKTAERAALATQENLARRWLLSGAPTSEFWSPSCQVLACSHLQTVLTELSSL